MNDTKLKKALQARIETIQKTIDYSRLQQERSVNERAMYWQYWRGFIEALETEMVALKDLIEK